MSEPFPTLPEDVIDEIISRLRCVKSIGRLRCVSKQCQSYLSTPQFVKRHLKIINTDVPENLICIADCSLYVIDFSTKEDINSAGVLRKIESPFPKGIDFEVGGSCNGLVLLVGKDYGDSMFLINPITLEAEKVHKDSLTSRFRAFGLGYDESKDDYKIVSLPREHFQNGKSVDVYSFKTKSWRRISNFGCPLQNLVFKQHGWLLDGYAGVFVDGCIHWIACGSCDRGRMHRILAFNLAREEFEEVLPPRAVQSLFEKEGSNSEIKVLRGCLAVMFSHGNHGNCMIDVWVMKDYGVRDSWTKLTFITFKWYSLHDVVFLMHDYELVLKECGMAFVACDSRNGVQKDFVFAGVPNSEVRPYRPKIGSFRGSLVSPNYK